jgi:hypothetical protein
VVSFLQDFRSKYCKYFPSLPCALLTPLHFILLNSIDLIILFASSWRWRQHGPPKRWYPNTTLHDVTTQKTSNINPKYLVKRTSYGARHYAFFSILPLTSKHSPQQPVLRHPQSMFFSQWERPSFTSIQNRYNCSHVYFNLQVFREETWRIFWSQDVARMGTTKHMQNFDRKTLKGRCLLE